VANRSNTVNGAEYQHANVGLELAISGDTKEVKTFKDISYEFSAETKATNNAEGDIDGWTMDNLKTTGAITMRLSEWFEIKKWAAEQVPELGILQIEFRVTVTFGPRLDNLKKDAFTMKFQKEMRKSTDNQDVLVNDIPIFIYDPDLQDGNPVKYSQQE
jgi:hypothetical protein